MIPEVPIGLFWTINIVVVEDLVPLDRAATFSTRTWMWSFYGNMEIEATALVGKIYKSTRFPGEFLAHSSMEYKILQLFWEYGVHFPFSMMLGNVVQCHQSGEDPSDAG